MGIQVGEAWECAQEDEVRGGQVEEVNINAAPLRQTEDVSDDNQQVAKETDAKLDPVGR